MMYLFKVLTKYIWNEDDEKIHISYVSRKCFHKLTAPEEFTKEES